MSAPFRVLLLVSAASGAAALIYEIVWFQLLQLIIGSTAVTMAVLLATYMGGMCIGSLLFAGVADARRHPLRAYAALEAAIAAAAILVTLALPRFDALYTAVLSPGPFVIIRATVAAVFLLPPTVLLGATLPAVARWASASREGVRWTGFFYGSNISGATVGCLVAGFVLLPNLDMTRATLVGAALNLACAGVAWALASRTPAGAVFEEVRSARAILRERSGNSRAGALVSDTSGKRPAGPAPGERSGKTWTIHAAVALSGAAALGAEVVWTRLLSLLFGATTYAFSIILAVFLAGLGIGSAIGSHIGARVSDARLALAATQLLAAGAIAWAGWLLADSLPYWPLNPSQARSAFLLFQLDLLRTAVTVLPAALLWGASVPLALAAVAAPERDAGRVIGHIYAANTVGAIAGACGMSLVAVQAIGTTGAQRVLIAVAVAAGVCALAARTRRERAPVWAFYAVGTALVLAYLLPPVPAMLLAYGRHVGITITGPFTVLFAGEGMNASVAVTETADGVRNFHVSGKIEASNHPQDMPLQRMLGHLPALIHAHPRAVLVVGFGAGVTAGSFVPYREVERIVVAEIEPLIPQVVATHFRRENHDVVRDRRVSLIYDDARHIVGGMRERFDIITSDPIHPWVRGSATLFTREYFERLRARLNPGGLVTQWIPLYESDAEVVRSELATFFEVFPEATIWANRQRGGGYDLVLLGPREAARIDLDGVRARLSGEGGARATASLAEVGFTTPAALFATYAGRARDLRAWLNGAQINTDQNLRLQYLAGLRANVYAGDAIFAGLQRYRRFPEGLFTGAPELVAELRRQLREGK